MVCARGKGEPGLFLDNFFCGFGDVEFVWQGEGWGILACLLVVLVCLLVVVYSREEGR